MAAVTRNIRWYQRGFHEYLVKGGKRAIEIAHRRWGKDEIALMATYELAMQRPGNVWHCLPEYAQGRRALWTAVNSHTGKRRIDEAFPPDSRASTNEQEMFIRFRNGSTWQIIGSDRFDATVGAGPMGIVYSEWALANPAAWGYHRPMLVENDGWAAFITTPRGRNHAKAMLEMAQKTPSWFAEVSTINDTHALSEEQLAEARAEYIAMFGEDVGRAQYEQEYLCSFNAAILGAFYAREMMAVRAEGRIADIYPLANRPVHTAWDIGVRDDTSIWWFQVVGTQVFVLDCYTAPGGNVEVFADICHAKPWLRGTDFVPHDAKVHEWGSGRTRLETMVRHGLNPVLVPEVSKLDGIQAARQTLGRAVFHPRCDEVGLPALEQYRREWDTDRKAYRESEVRDWTTHLADAFRYMALAWRSVPVEKKPQRLLLETGQVFLPGPPEPQTGIRIKV